MNGSYAILSYKSPIGEYLYTCLYKWTIKIKYQSRVLENNEKDKLSSD